MRKSVEKINTEKGAALPNIPISSILATRNSQTGHGKKLRLSQSNSKGSLDLYQNNGLNNNSRLQNMMLDKANHEASKHDTHREPQTRKIPSQEGP